LHGGSVVKHNKIETGIYKTFHRLSFSRSGGRKFYGLRFRTNGVGTWRECHVSISKNSKRGCIIAVQPWEAYWSLLASGFVVGSQGFCPFAPPWIVIVVLDPVLSNHWMVWGLNYPSLLIF